MGKYGTYGPASRRKRHGEVFVDAWYGLRYASAPYRFGPPSSARGRLDVGSLLEIPIFPQLPSRLSAAMGTGQPNPQAEDAYFVNVWSPSSAEGLPVLVFIHGGAWVTGGGSMEWYDGGLLASQGMVVVTVNYRLGALGHLAYSEPCELPLPAMDLLEALRWVNENITAFGGDSARLTLAGQSAGGWYAHLLSVLPQARGLLRRVALLSMGTRRPWTPLEQAEVAARTQQALGGTELAAAPVDALMKAGGDVLAPPAPVLGLVPSSYLPVAGLSVPDRMFDPGWAARSCHAEAIYLRCTRDEAATFFFMSPFHTKATQADVDLALSAWEPDNLPASLKNGTEYIGVASGLSPYRQLVAASSWRQFQRFPSEYEHALAAEGRPARLEYFSDESPLKYLHSGHCLDLPFQFGTRDAWMDAPMLKGFGRDRFDEISHRLVTDLAGFAME